jgi:hypothetical protein
MPKRRQLSLPVSGLPDVACRVIDGFVLFDNSTSVHQTQAVVVVTSKDNAALEPPFIHTACGYEQAPAGLLVVWATRKRQASVQPTLTTQATGNKQAVPAPVEHTDLILQATKQEAMARVPSTLPAPTLTKAEAREWLAALGERVSTAMTSAELKVKIQNIFCEPPTDGMLSKVVTSMPQKVLTKLVKWIIIQQEKEGSAKEEHLGMIIHQVNLLQQMDHRMHDIANQIIQRSTANLTV